MECIFCHKDSSSSKSIEHIIPESLGNKHHVLPAGYVCDACNNYFAIKIEKELLAQPYFVSMRCRKEIKTKKGKLVEDDAFFPETDKHTKFAMSTDGDVLQIHIMDKDVYEDMEKGRTHKFAVLCNFDPSPNNYVMSRFLAKCAYEYFLYNVGADNYEKCVEELLGSKGDVMKGLREYARYGKGKYWEYCQKRIHPEVCFFIDKETGSIREKLFSMRLYTNDCIKKPNGYVEAEMYYVLIMMGVEYVLCISDPSMTDYMKEWQNNGKSHLIDDDEQILFPRA